MPTSDGRASNSLTSQLEPLRCDMAELKADIKEALTKLSELTLRYETRHTSIEKDVEAHGVRIADLEREVKELRDSVRPLVLQAKILGWFAAIMGSTLIVFIWSIVTHQVTVVIP